VTLAAVIAGSAATLRSRSAHPRDALDSQTLILAQSMLGASIV
jgi:hypothetical protein